MVFLTMKQEILKKAMQEIFKGLNRKGAKQTVLAVSHLYSLHAW